MSQEYPNITELIIGGQSYEGRQILGLRINSPSLHKKGKPVFFIESGDINLRKALNDAHHRFQLSDSVYEYLMYLKFSNIDPIKVVYSIQIDFTDN